MANQKNPPCKQHAESNQIALAIIQNPKSMSLDFCPFDRCQNPDEQLQEGQQPVPHDAVYPSFCQCLNTTAINNTDNNNDDDDVCFEV